ncbi:hypothetical protein [Pararhodobacter oceanensis]|uniref:Lipoprotein n=1 Tax=Pararhodobacter oceanensis TaxID=2172121 RepID=A0A2T8HYQ8_9RHOB|nr:hypothetical protein [Pararhodobacter oceanensis]PVH30554.1 hypothetical protein DDE20_03220 [Pararhodobacter oceanensis]
MTHLTRLLALCSVLILAACTKPVVWAPEEDVIAARYVHDGPTEIVVYNVINNESGRGEHAALLINASQRVLFDPAGSWTHPESPERHDVHYGITPRQLFRYTYYHARRTHHVRIQHLEVPPATAEYILRLAEQNGPVADAYCARSIFDVLRQVPGFEGFEPSFYPNRLSEQFAQVPGVTEERIYSDAEPTERQQYTQ